MIGAILLAAGQSRRMGTQKLLLPFAGTTVIAHIAGQIQAAGIDKIFAVTGRDHGRIASALANQEIALIPNPTPDGDMLSSVRTGLRALPPDCTDVLVALGDQPNVTPAVIRQLVSAHARSPGITVPIHAGRRGHPLVFSTRYREEILTHFEDEGLRGLLAAHAADILEIPVNLPAVLTDMDHPADYHREIDATRSDPE